MSQRAPLPMTLALIITTLGFATLIFVQGDTSPPLIYGGFCAGMVVGNFILAALLLVISEEAGKRLPGGEAYVKEAA